MMIATLSRAFDYQMQLQQLWQVMSWQQESWTVWLIRVFLCQKILKLLWWFTNLTLYPSKLDNDSSNLFMTLVPLVCVCWPRLCIRKSWKNVKFSYLMVWQNVAQHENVIEKIRNRDTSDFGVFKQEMLT